MNPGSTAKPALRTKTCVFCQTRFSCGSGQAVACWCNQYPAIMSMDIQHDCLCQECLHKVIREKTENYAQAFLAGLTDGKAAKKLGPATAPMEGIDYHKDDAGRYVFTAWFHLRRGKCCGNKCRHCPYNHINVPA